MPILLRALLTRLIQAHGHEPRPTLKSWTPARPAALPQFLHLDKAGAMMKMKGVWALCSNSAGRGVLPCRTRCAWRRRTFSSFWVHEMPHAAPRSRPICPTPDPHKSHLSRTKPLVGCPGFVGGEARGFAALAAGLSPPGPLCSCLHVPFPRPGLHVCVGRTASLRAQVKG